MGLARPEPTRHSKPKPDLDPKPAPSRCVEASLVEALHETREHEPFGAEWSARFGDIMKPCHRHDVKLGLEAPPVRAALASLLGALQR